MEYEGGGVGGVSGHTPQGKHTVTMVVMATTK